MASAQLPVIQLFQTQPSIGFTDPSGANTLKYWWVSSDVTPSITVCNWIDRVSSFLFTNGNAAKRPVTGADSSQGIIFDSTTFLTNQITMAQSNTVVFVMTVTNRTATYSSFWADLAGSLAWNMNDGGSDGKMYEINSAAGLFPTNVWMDWMWYSDATQPNVYTNNILSATTVTGSGTWKAIGANGGVGGINGLKMSLREIMFWSNSLNAVQRSNVHYYVTNTYKFTP